MSSRRIRKGRMSQVSWSALLAFAVLLAVQAEADDSAARGRQVVGRWEKAVVTVRVTIKIRMAERGRESGEQESTLEGRATFIDPDGLAVLSLSDIDPTIMLSAMMGEQPETKMETEVRDVKLRLASGKEVPGKIVLRDKDLGLAFARPADKLDEALSPISLADSAKPEILDEIVILSRLGELANRTTSVCLDRVQAIVTKPRTMYIPGLGAMIAGTGCPVFSLDGKLVGLLVMRAAPPQAARTGFMPTDLLGLNILPIILPAGEILEVAKQARQTTGGQAPK